MARCVWCHHEFHLGVECPYRCPGLIERYGTGAMIAVMSAARREGRIATVQDVERYHGQVLAALQSSGMPVVLTRRFRVPNSWGWGGFWGSP
jgi:hypothetical protein